VSPWVFPKGEGSVVITGIFWLALFALFGLMAADAHIKRAERPWRNAAKRASG